MIEIKNKALFDRLVAEALTQDFSGWDFSFVNGRWIESPMSWNYREQVGVKQVGANALLDMGTGSGEFLSSLSPFPPHSYATEAHAPNVPIARARLEPLGVRVVEIHSDDVLPFEDNYFDLIVNRHEAYSTPEVYRILKPGGTFMTQQVGGGNCVELNEFLQSSSPRKAPHWNLACALKWLLHQDFQIVLEQEEFPEMVVRDIGAVVFYLKTIPWQIRDFSVERYYDRLAALHNLIQETGRFVMHAHRFFIEARKP